MTKINAPGSFSHTWGKHTPIRQHLSYGGQFYTTGLVQQTLLPGRDGDIVSDSMCSLLFLYYTCGSAGRQSRWQAVTQSGIGVPELESNAPQYYGLCQVALFILTYVVSGHMFNSQRK